MSKKIVYIVLGALLIFGLLFLLWSWFFSGTKSGTPNSGLFGTASDTVQTGGGTVPGGNYTTTLGQNGSGQNSANGSIPLNGQGGTNGTNGNTNSTSNGTSNGTTGTGATLSLDALNGQSVSKTDALNAQKARANGTINTGGTLGSGGTPGSTGGTGTIGTGGGTIGSGGTVGNGGTSGGTVGNGGTSGGTLGTGGINSTPTGVIWLGGGVNFNPTDINSLSSGAGGFAPTISSNTGGGGNSGTTLVEALGAATLFGSLTCALQAAVVSVSGVGLASSVAAGGSILLFSASGAPVSDIGNHAGEAATVGLLGTQDLRNASIDTSKFAQCIINVWAKTFLKVLTASVVNWINSGFNGQPSFINNFQQFFTNVADLAAGQFIQGTGLAFLCSPFKLQIKVAIAQSYANRGAQSCSLTGIIKNINNFMNGSFSQGGWPGLLSFTTMPTNNPYGALAYAQVGLISAQSTAAANAKNNISPTGFLNLQKVTGCTGTYANLNGIGASGSIGTNAQAAQAAVAFPAGSNCKASVTTPGDVIAQSLNKVNGSTVDQLGIGNSVDQIITALTQQLMTTILTKGLSSLSQGTTQTPADLAAQQQAVTLLNDMQNKVNIAQQVGTIDQGSISDIESAQNNLNNLANCWSAVASTSATGAALASQNAATAQTTLASLNTQIAGYNNNITQLNAQIGTLDAFEAQVSSAATVADVAAAAASYNAAITAGTFPSQADVTTAQQNRSTLQGQLATINASTQASLLQCEASPH